MSEQKKRIGFTVACVNEFARHHNLSVQGAYSGFRNNIRRSGSFFVEGMEASYEIISWKQC